MDKNRRREKAKQPDRARESKRASERNRRKRMDKQPNIYFFSPKAEVEVDIEQVDVFDGTIRQPC